MLGYIKKSDHEAVVARERRKIAELEHRLETSKSTIKNQRNTLSAYEDKFAEQEARHERAVEKVNIENRALTELQNEAMENTKTRIELDIEQEVLEAKKNALGTMEEALEKKEEEFEKRLASAKQEFYADGLADGLRKAHEITAEDRKQMAQVAALAASSHHPAASLEVANAVSKNLLGTGEEKEDDKKKK